MKTNTKLFLTGAVSVLLSLMLILGMVAVWPVPQMISRTAMVAARAAAVKGDTGPTGPQGLPGVGAIGPQGPAGPAGTSVDLTTLWDDPAFREAVTKAMAPVPVGAVVTQLQNTQEMGQWKIQYYTGATDLMKGFVFTDFVPGWKAFPNEDWPAGNFLSKNGLEFGQQLSDFCQQDQTCDFPVAARSYRSITGDYNISGIGECHEAGTGIGCGVIIVNVGDVMAEYRNQMVDSGYTVTGLYWNGNELDQAISAWASHVAYRMIGIPSSNPADPGSNCSVPTGCKGDDLTFAVTSGLELLMLGHAVVQP